MSAPRGLRRKVKCSYSNSNLNSRRNFYFIAGVFFVLAIVQLEQMRVLRALYDYHSYQEGEDRKLVERGRRDSAMQMQREREDAMRREEEEIQEAMARSLEMTRV